MIINELDKVHGDRKEVIPPNDVADSCTIKSIDIQEDVHEEYKQSCVDNSPPVHPCLTTREGEQQIVPTCGKGQKEDFQRDSSEELVLINQHDEHDHEGKHEKYSMRDELFLESQ